MRRIINFKLGLFWISNLLWCPILAYKLSLLQSFLCYLSNGPFVSAYNLLFTISLSHCVWHDFIKHCGDWFAIVFYSISIKLLTYVISQSLVIGVWTKCSSCPIFWFKLFQPPLCILIHCFHLFHILIKLLHSRWLGTSPKVIP